MALPANRRARDLRLSVAHHVGNTLSVTTPSQVAGGAPVVLTVPIYHDWPLGDPDSMRDPSGAQQPAWVGTTWVQDGAGMRGYSILQVDIYTRIGAPGNPAGDSFGLANADVCDAFVSAFAGVKPSGSLAAYVPILDFDIPTAPVVPPAGEGGCLVMQTPQGQFGVPSERRSLGRKNGFVRTVMRLHFRTTEDAIRGAGTAYYAPQA